MELPPGMPTPRETLTGVAADWAARHAEGHRHDRTAHHQAATAVLTQAAVVSDRYEAAERLVDALEVPALRWESNGLAMSDDRKLFHINERCTRLQRSRNRQQVTATREEVGTRLCPTCTPEKTWKHVSAKHELAQATHEHTLALRVLAGAFEHLDRPETPMMERWLAQATRLVRARSLPAHERAGAAIIELTVQTRKLWALVRNERDIEHSEAWFAAALFPDPGRRSKSTPPWGRPPSTDHLDHTLLRVGRDNAHQIRLQEVWRAMLAALATGEPLPAAAEKALNEWQLDDAVSIGQLDMTFVVPPGQSCLTLADLRAQWTVAATQLQADIVASWVTDITTALQAAAALNLAPVELTVDVSDPQTRQGGGEMLAQLRSRFAVSPDPSDETLSPTWRVPPLVAEWLLETSGFDLEKIQLQPSSDYSRAVLDSCMSLLDVRDGVPAMSLCQALAGASALHTP